MTATPPPFEVAFDRDARRLRWTMRGFWTMADVMAYAADLRAATAVLGPPPQAFDALCDARDFAVQTREVSDALGAIERIGSTQQNGRVAVVVGSIVNKLQAQRTLTGGEVRVFLSMEEAEAWLNGKVVDPA